MVQGVAPDPSPEEAAAGYLARELASGGHHFSVDVGGTLYADYGVTADAVLALDAAGAGQAEASAATKYLADNVVNYTGFGDPTEISAGSVAKLLNVAAAQGLDVKAFGGFDLVGTLRSLEQPSGQFRDVSKYGDYSNVFGQSLALMGLKRTGTDPSTASVAFLVAQQCADGGFRLDFGASPCSSDPDATAMAVQALIAVNGSSDANAVKGLNYLTGRQSTSGGVGGGGPTSAVNANSTGLAGQAFLAGGRVTQARLANRFLVGLQYDCAFPAALRGGVAYDSAAFAAQQQAGPSAKAVDQDRRSTTQAMLSLSGTPLYAVTAEGAVAGAPVMVCASPTRSTTTTPPPTTTPRTTTTRTTTTSTASAAAPGTTSPTSTSSATKEPLAYTGAQALPLGALALGLLAVGVALLLLSRRRGTHA
jgi:cell division septation protein DedD